MRSRHSHATRAPCDRALALRAQAGCRRGYVLKQTSGSMLPSSIPKSRRRAHSCRQPWPLEVAYMRDRRQLGQRVGRRCALEAKMVASSRPSSNARRRCTTSSGRFVPSGDLASVPLRCEVSHLSTPHLTGAVLCGSSVPLPLSMVYPPSESMLKFSCLDAIACQPTCVCDYIPNPVQDRITKV